MSAEAERNKTKTPPQYELKPGKGPSLLGTAEPQSKAHVPTDMEKLYPGMRSPQSIVMEIAHNTASVDATTAKSPETLEEEETAILHPGMRSPDSVRAEQVAQVINEKRSKETQNAMEKQRKIIKDYMEQQDAEMIAMFASRNSKQSQGHLTAEQIRFIVNGMKDGGNIKLNTPEENSRIIEEDEKELHREAGGVNRALGWLNRNLMSESAPKEKKAPPNPELLQKPLPVPETLAVKVDDKKVKELIESAKTQPTPELTADEKYINENLADKTPAEILAQLKLGDFIKTADIQIQTPAGERVDPLKKDYLLNAVRLRHAAEAVTYKVSGKMTEELDATYKSSKDAQSKIRAAIKDKMNLSDDEAADREFRKFVDGYKNRLAEEYKKATGSGKVVQSSEVYRFQIAQEVVSQLHSVLPDITAEEFLAAVYIIESQENLQKASLDYQRQLFEKYNEKKTLDMEKAQKIPLLESPVKVQIILEDVISAKDLNGLLIASKTTPSPELLTELTQVLSHTLNRDEAIRHFGLEGFLDPNKIRTDNDFEGVEAVDMDKIDILEDAIRLRHIVSDNLTEIAKEKLEQEIPSRYPKSYEMYRNVHQFIETNQGIDAEQAAEKFNDYHSEFRNRVDEEIKRRAGMLKPLRNLNSTQLPSKLLLGPVRRVIAAQYVNEHKAELPTDMTTEQFLAAMSVAETFQMGQRKIKDEVFQWFNRDYVPLKKESLQDSKTSEVLVSPINVQNLKTAEFFRENSLVDLMKEYKGTKGDEIRGKIDTSSPEEIIEEYDLSPPYEAKDFADPDKRVELLETIYLRQISRDVFKQNFDNRSTSENNLLVVNKKVTKETVDAFDKYETVVSKFLPEFFKKMDVFQNKLLEGKGIGINRLTPADYRLLNEARIRFASQIYIDHKEEMPSDSSPLQLLTAFSLAETYFQIKDEIFNDIVASYEGLKTAGINDDPDTDAPPNPPNPPPPSGGSGGGTGAAPAVPTEASPASGVIEPTVPTPSESGDVTQTTNNASPSRDQSVAAGQTGTENRNAAPIQEKKKRRNVLDFVTGKGEEPAVFLKSNNLLITGPRVESVHTSDLIKINDVVTISLPKIRTEQQENILRMEIENRDLNDIVTKWKLKTLFSESYVANDIERIRQSQSLVDAIILRDISREYFDRLKPTFDAQLATIVPRQSLEQYQAHEAEVLKLYPQFQQLFRTQYAETVRSRLATETDPETRQKAFIASRNIAAREIFQRHQHNMPEGSTPEKLLAALSLQETYLQIQDKIFQDLYSAYINPPSPDNNESNNPPNEPPPPPRGSGPRTPPPSTPPTSPGSRQTENPYGLTTEAQPNPDFTLVETKDDEASSKSSTNLISIVDKNALVEDPVGKIKSRLQNLANSTN